MKAQTQATGKSQPMLRAARRESEGAMTPSWLWSKKERWRWKGVCVGRMVGIDVL